MIYLIYLKELLHEVKRSLTSIAIGLIHFVNKLNVRTVENE